jgi:hypothetical protein
LFYCPGPDVRRAECPRLTQSGHRVTVCWLVTKGAKVSEEASSEEV